MRPYRAPLYLPPLLSILVLSFPFHPFLPDLQHIINMSSSSFILALSLGGIRYIPAYELFTHPSWRSGGDSPGTLLGQETALAQRSMVTVGNALTIANWLKTDQEGLLVFNLSIDSCGVSEKTYEQIMGESPSFEQARPLLIREELKANPQARTSIKLLTGEDVSWVTEVKDNLDLVQSIEATDQRSKLFARFLVDQFGDRRFNALQAAYEPGVTEGEQVVLVRRADDFTTIKDQLESYVIDLNVGRQSVPPARLTEWRNALSQDLPPVIAYVRAAETLLSNP